MPSLLPNQKLTYQGDKELLVDGKKAVNLEQRLEILQSLEPQSRAMHLKDFISMSLADQKKYIVNQK